MKKSTLGRRLDGAGDDRLGADRAGAAGQRRLPCWQLLQLPRHDWAMHQGGDALPGRPAEAYIIEQMVAFRDGKRPATIMHPVAKGYTDQQIEAIADTSRGRSRTLGSHEQDSNVTPRATAGTCRTAGGGTLRACATMGSRKSIGKVVVVGAGYGGATAAKYLRPVVRRDDRRHAGRSRARRLFPARSPTWCWAARRRWPTSPSATPDSTSTASSACGTP